MKSGLNNTMVLMLAAVCVLAISLAEIAGAATAPAVTTQESLVNSINTPLKSAVDANGDIYVADPRSGGVVVLDQYGMLKSRIVLPDAVTALALISPAGNINGGKLVVSQGTTVAVLDASGAELSRLGGGYQFQRISAIAVDAGGNIYVADSGSNTIKKFSSAGGFLKEFGAGKFLQPVSLAVAVTAAGEQVAVVDILKGNVQFFTTDGVYVSFIGTKGTFSPLVFNFPTAVTFEYAGGVLFRMYVLDMYEGRLQAIDAVSGAFLGFVGNYGSAPGSLMTPADVVFDQQNSRLLVANGLSNIVSYGVDGGRNPVNSTPPVLTVTQSNISVTDPSAILSGTVDSGCTLSASAASAVKVGAASFPSATSWTVPVSNLVAGLNVISVTARNQYGVSTTKSVNVTYRPPANTLTVNAYPAITPQASIQISGTADNGSVVTVTNATTAITGNASLIDNQWSITLTLVEGPNTISISASKANVSTTQQDIVIALDSLAPVLLTSLPADGSSTANPLLSVAGTIQDQTAVKLSVNGVPVAVTGGQFNTAVALALGANSVAITAVDAVGNQTVVARTITFAPGFPSITVQTPPDGTYTNKQDVVVSGSASVGATVKVNTLPAVVDAVTGVWTATIRLVAGQNSIDVSATDVYGQTSTERRTITYDNVAPQVTITNPSQNAAFNNPGLTVTGKVVETTGAFTIKATVNGVDKNVQVTGSDFSLFIEFATEGTYTVAITVTDSANNSTTILRTVIYDVTAPLITADPATSSTKIVTGSVESGATVEVKDAAGASAKVTVTGNSWSADLGGVAFDFSTLMARATDAAGNTSVVKIDYKLNNYVYTLKDALLVLNLVTSGQQPTAAQLDKYDVGPLLNGKRNPNGKLEIVDAILILRNALGLPSWK